MNEEKIFIRYRGFRVTEVIIVPRVSLAESIEYFAIFLRVKGVENILKAV